MKSYSFLLSALMAVAVVSCNQDSFNQGGGGSGSGNNPAPYAGDTALTTDQQVENLKSTATTLMDALALDQWKSDADWVYNTLDAISNGNYDLNEDCEEYIDSIRDLWQKTVEGNTFSLYTYTIRLSQAKGHYTEKYGVFSYEPADDLRIDLTVNGEPIAVTFTCTDSSDSYFLYENDDDYSSAYSYHEYHYEYYVSIPSSADLKLFRGGNVFASLHLDLNFQDKNNNKKIEPEKDGLGAQFTLSAGAYQLTANNADYSPSSGSINFSFTGNGKKLLSASAEANYSWDNDGDFSPKKADISLDFAGMTQIKGKVIDYDVLEETVKMIDQAKTSAAQQAALPVLEACYNLNVYYNGHSLSQATLGFDLVPYEYSRTGARVVPVIRFADGSSIAADIFFSEDYFETLITQAENWWKQIERYIDSKDWYF